MNATILPTSSALQQEVQEVIEVKLWSLYLLINRSHLYQEIIDASLDQGPVEKNPQKPGRVTFRFSTQAWHSKVKGLLYSYRIPVIVNSPLGNLITRYQQRWVA